MLTSGLVMNVGYLLSFIVAGVKIIELLAKIHTTQKVSLAL